MSRAAIYLRVSSKEQTVENQLPALEKWVADRGHDGMSVGLGRIEKRVLKILEWERKNNGGALRRILDYRDGVRTYQECDTTVSGLVDSILYGCSKDDHPCLNDRLGKVYRSLYQSVCRAVRSLERKGLVKTGKGILFWEDGWGYKTVTLMEDRAKHLDTAGRNVGVNI